LANEINIRTEIQTLFSKSFRSLFIVASVISKQLIFHAVFLGVLIFPLLSS